MAHTARTAVGRNGKRARRWAGFALGASALLLVAAAFAWSARDPWAAGMLVLASHPTGTPLPRPVDVGEEIEVARTGARVRAWVFEPAAQAPARGTVLMLHGIRDSKIRLVSGAREHAARGHRVVAVDSRGHGESSGRYLTYGVEEARDLVALVDELARRSQLVRPLAVVGSSYGAATALQFAALDPRVERVVALAPFASLREVVPAFIEWVLGSPARWIPRGVIDDLIDHAAARAGFDPEDACPRCVASRIRAAVLLIHSRDDERIPWQQSVEIHDALRGPSAKLMLVDGVSHVRTGAAAGVAEATQRWLDAP